MSKPNNARVERNALSDLFTVLGPDQPTLCEGWTTRDLAAHLVVRDRRPDAAAGAVIKALASRANRVRNEAAARDWAVLIEQVRNPPSLSLAGFEPLDRATNTGEFFIHHEDVRRAQPGWEPRPLGPELNDTLYAQLKLTSKLRLRRFPARLKINVLGYPEPVIAGAGGPELDISGEPGELTLFFSGRQKATRVTIVGPEELVDRLRETHLGL